MDGEKAPLHSSAVRPQLQATTIGLAAPPPASSELRGEVIPARDSQPGSLWACFCPECLPSRSFLLASALAPPFASLSSPRPLVPGQPPAASPSGKQHLPQTYSLSRQSTERPPTPGLSPSRALSGPESGSAEVPGPATPALSREREREAQPQSPTALPGWTISGRTGEEEPRDAQISGAISRWDVWDLDKTFRDTRVVETPWISTHILPAPLVLFALVVVSPV